MSIPGLAALPLAAAGGFPIEFSPCAEETGGRPPVSVAARDVDMLLLFAVELMLLVADGEPQPDAERSAAPQARDKANVRILSFVPTALELNLVTSRCGIGHK